MNEGKLKSNREVFNLSDENFYVIINRNDPLQFMRGAEMYFKKDSSKTWPIEMGGKTDTEIIEEAEAIYIIKNLSKLK